VGLDCGGCILDVGVRRRLKAMPDLVGAWI